MAYQVFKRRRKAAMNDELRGKGVDELINLIVELKDNVDEYVRINLNGII